LYASSIDTLYELHNNPIDNDFQYDLKKILSKEDFDYYGDINSKNEYLDNIIKYNKIWDNELNFVYNLLKDKLDSVSKSYLINAQKSWLRYYLTLDKIHTHFLDSVHYHAWGYFEYQNNLDLQRNLLKARTIELMEYRYSLNDIVEFSYKQKRKNVKLDKDNYFRHNNYYIYIGFDPDTDYETTIRNSISSCPICKSEINYFRKIQPNFNNFDEIVNKIKGYDSLYINEIHYLKNLYKKNSSKKLYSMIDKLITSWLDFLNYENLFMKEINFKYKRSIYFGILTESQINQLNISKNKEFLMQLIELYCNIENDSEHVQESRKYIYKYKGK
jgi:uncharacterized protein YecT (DUF1311 family)